MTDKNAGSGDSVSPPPAHHASSQGHTIVRTIVWIAVAAVTLWVFYDLIAKH
jgi:hypothetical protein